MFSKSKMIWIKNNQYFSNVLWLSSKRGWCKIRVGLSNWYLVEEFIEEYISNHLFTRGNRSIACPSVALVLMVHCPRCIDQHDTALTAAIGMKNTRENDRTMTWWEFWKSIKTFWIAIILQTQRVTCKCFSRRTISTELFSTGCTFVF